MIIRTELNLALAYCSRDESGGLSAPGSQGPFQKRGLRASPVPACPNSCIDGQCCVQLGNGELSGGVILPVLCDFFFPRDS